MTSKNQYLRSALQILATGSLSLTLSNCALTTEKIVINHSALPGAQAVPGAGKVTVSAQDERNDKTKVSYKKNGYGMEMAAIESERDVSDIFRTALETELQSRGFQIGGGRTVDVKVLRFYNDFKIGMWSGDAVADVEIQVAVKGTGFSKRIEVKGQEHAIQIAGGNNARAALEDGLNNALTSLFKDESFVRALK